MPRRPASFVLLSMLLTGCRSDPLAPAADGGGRDLATAIDLAKPVDLATAADAQTGCAPVYASDLPGVSFALTAKKCTFTLAEAAAGVHIDYVLGSDREIANVVPLAQSCLRDPRPLGLFTFERLAGNGQHYCLCDVGLCMAPQEIPITIPAGTSPASFEWDGRNWDGPSDTGNPKGPPFPPGVYTLDVSAVGKRGIGGPGWTVRMTVPITIVP